MDIFDPPKPSGWANEILDSDPCGVFQSLMGRNGTQHKLWALRQMEKAIPCQVSEVDGTGKAL